MCPYCGGTMEFGYIKSSHPINWVKPGSGFYKKSYQISSDGSNFELFSGYKLQAHRCTKCKTIIFNYL